MSKNLCLIYNSSLHYRKSIFSLLDNEFNIDFIFGDKYLDVENFDYSILKGSTKKVKNIKLIIQPYSFQTGVIKAVFKKYDGFILLGDIYSLSTWILILLSKLYKRKVYLWSHGWYGREGFIKKNVKKAYFSLANGVFLYGNYAKKLMINAGLCENKLHVIYNSLNYKEHFELRNKFLNSDIFYNKFRNSNYNLIFIGRLTVNKQLDLLILALDLLKKANTECNLTIIGSGEEEQKLKNLAISHGLQNQIWFFGSCYYETTIAELISNADICVSPGNVGLTAIHALSYGTPVITHANFSRQMPEFEAIIPELTGAFFEFGNYQSLADKIECWISNKKDRSKIREFCYEEIDLKWNPYSQLKIFKEVLSQC